jgi:hypothetical protein
LRGPRDYAAVRQALARAGYNGEKIVILTPTGEGGMRTLSPGGADQLRRAGMNVELQEMELGNVIRRRLNQAVPDKGLERVFLLLRQIEPKHQPLWQHLDTRRRARRLRRLADEPAHRSLARCLARRRQLG